MRFRQSTQTQTPIARQPQALLYSNAALAMNAGNFYVATTPPIFVGNLAQVGIAAALSQPAGANFAVLSVAWSDTAAGPGFAAQSIANLTQLTGALIALPVLAQWVTFTVVGRAGTTDSVNLSVFGVPAGVKSTQLLGFYSTQIGATNYGSSVLNSSVGGVASGGFNLFPEVGGLIAPGRWQLTITGNFSVFGQLQQQTSDGVWIITAGCGDSSFPQASKEVSVIGAPVRVSVINTSTVAGTVGYVLAPIQV